MKALFSGLIVVFLATFSSCYWHVPKEKRECYKVVNDFAKENWKTIQIKGEEVIVEDSILYQTSIFDKELYHCIVSLNRTEIKKIFGDPHEKYGKNGDNEGWNYYTTYGCRKRSIKKFGQCSYYNFIFNKEGLCFKFSPAVSFKDY